MRSPLTEEMASLPSKEAITHSTEKNEMQTTQSPSLEQKQNKVSQLLDHMSYLVVLAVFGIIGLGSFLMGWFGKVFKKNISNTSDHLAIGLTTGFLGSLTTFSRWNQKMLDYSSTGHWVFTIGGYILGMFCVNECFRYGVLSAEGLSKKLHDSSGRTRCSLEHWRVDGSNKQVMALIVMLLIWVLLILGSVWGLSRVWAKTELDGVANGAILWLGCLVCPLGVWARWYLTRLNNHRIGRQGLLKWLPIGTLSANVLAACVMAALATINKAVNNKTCGILVSGFEFGFLGCLSTVSTFVSELYSMKEEEKHRWREPAYIAATILPSFASGTLIYSVPVWAKHYD